MALPNQPFQQAKQIVAEVQSTFGYLRRQVWTAPDDLDADDLLALTATSDSVATVLTPTAQPDFPRSISVTPGGTTADVASGAYTVLGTNIRDEVISEDLTFAANATTLQSTLKAFKTVVSVTCPIQDGADATFSIGFIDRLGLDRIMTGNEVILATADGVYETTRPTVTFSASDIALNTIDLNTALDSSKDIVAVFVSTEKTFKNGSTS